MPRQPKKTIDEVVIHMYTIGTGDCFVLKFRSKGEVTFKMLIDCGCWKRKFVEIRPYVEELKKDVGNKIDLLVITHEHTDHVLGFQAAKELFTNNFTIKEIWMAWTEDDENSKVKKWKKDYGDKKKALALAAMQLDKVVRDPNYRQQFKGSRNGKEMFAMRKKYASVVRDFSDLHFYDGEQDNLHVSGEEFPEPTNNIDGILGVERVYKGSLKGMAVVKDNLAKNNIKYVKPGDIMEKLAGLIGVKIYVLGPPLLYEEVKEESGGAGESYQHNRVLEESDLFVSALAANGEASIDKKVLPFDKNYFYTDAPEESKIYKKRGYTNPKEAYENKKETWRRIDYDWMFSSGQLALRMNSLTNNLSVVLAFEFEKSGKVMLFPGDAEFGSWKSWHKLKWNEGGDEINAEKLLNKVIFYKVAHHLSHNGTAMKHGLDMMTDPDLVAMATLDYNVISNGWKSTMPNRLIMKDLLEKTKGRTIVMNLDGLHYDLDNNIPLENKIKEHRNRLSPKEKREFNKAYDNTNKFYLEYVLKV